MCVLREVGMGKDVVVIGQGLAGMFTGTDHYVHVMETLTHHKADTLFVASVAQATMNIVISLLFNN